MTVMKRIGEIILKEPVKRSLLISLAVFVFTFIAYFFDNIGYNALMSGAMGGLAIGVLFVFPIVLTVYNVLFLVWPNQSAEAENAGRRVEYISVIFGAFCAWLWSYLNFNEVMLLSDWHVQLYNSELHAPVATWTWPTVTALAAVAFIGYLILRIKRLSDIPPLLATLCIGALYLGIILCTVALIQLAKHDFFIPLYLFSLILIFAKVIKELVLDYRTVSFEEPKGKSKFVTAIHRLVANSINWPWLGIIAALPLLGLIVAVLALFGQSPDSIIQAWTQTADWTFSQQIPPQNIYQDMHYLCTVAAGGHKEVVKPIRVGKRHGHRVLVNRQLCVANAFEQLMEERIPRIHRFVRHVYDKYGYPVAKHIRSPYVADVVWFLMKPLEWFFLAVLYLFDKKPENRIAVQYPHAPLPEE